MFAGLLDTSVLWPNLQRDVLLSFAAEGLYRPLWSSAILAELEYARIREWRRQGVPRAEAQARAAHLLAEMRRAFEDAEVSGWVALDGSFGLPDVDDEHVVAAAVVGGAGVIVTHNLRDFPPARIPAGIEVQPPAVFAHHVVSINPAAAARAIAEIAARSGRHGPAHTVEEILAVLERRYGMTDAVRILRAL